MFVCMYMYACMYMYVHVYAYLRTYIRTCICMYVSDLQLHWRRKKPCFLFPEGSHWYNHWTGAEGLPPR